MIRAVSRSQIAAALAALAALDVKLSEILYFILSSSPQHIDSSSRNRDALDDLLDHNNYLILLDLFKSNPAFASGTNSWILHCTTGHLIDEVRTLTKKSSGWHGYARASTVEQFEAIDFSDLALTGKSIAPTIWGLFEQLFSIPGDSDHGDDSIIDIDDDANNAMDLDDNDMQSNDTSTDREYRIRELVCTPMTLLK